MTPPSKTRLLSVLVLVLAVLNVGTLGLLWLGRPRHPPPGPPAGDVAAYVVRELRFNSRQQQQYADLRAAHRRRMGQLLPELAACKQALFAGLAQPAADTAAPAAALDQIAALHRRADWLTYRHFEQVRALATPAQQRRLAEIAPALPQMLLQQDPSRAPERPPLP